MMNIRLISDELLDENYVNLFDKNGYIECKNNFKFNIGDIVYIYSKSAEKILFKTFVDFNSNKENVKFNLIEKTDNDGLSFDKLQENGLKSISQPSVKINKKLENYINNFFKPQIKMWMVRAGKQGVKFDSFKNNEFAGIGWDLGDITGKSKKEIKTLCNEKFFYGPEDNLDSDVSNIDTFVNNINIGDYILTSSDKNQREYLLGKCISDYFYSKELDTDKKDSIQYINCRKVEWLCVFKWDDIEQEIKPPKTIFEINYSIINEILELFKPIKSFQTGEKRNLIYFGAPGTGKSYNLNKEMNNLLKEYLNNFERVTFHPDYTYANFVGTYKPVPDVDDNGNQIISYKYVPGPFMRTLVKALKNPLKPFVLVIEEINRANVASVFGDIFQLLDRDKNNISEYSINISEDMKDYLKSELQISKFENTLTCPLRRYLNDLTCEDLSQIKIPSNMFLWATMNSADQGVFPMDTAFKRRWNFKYFDINHGENELKDIKITLNHKEFTWNEIRRAINDQLISYKINEDKLMGPFFAFKDIENLSKDQFKEIFKNKILMYLFEDVGKSRRNDLFEGARSRQKNKENITYYQICDDFDENELKIFSKNILKDLNLVNK